MNEQEGLVEQALRIMRRRRWVVLQAIVAVPLLALLFSLSQEKQYTATATLLFREPPAALSDSSSVVDPTREAATNSELVALPVVAEQASRTLNGAIPAGEILAAVTVTPSMDADTAEIAAVSTSPERAAAIANAYGEAYIEFRRRADRAQVQEAIDLAETTLGELTATERAGEQGAALNRQLDELRLIQALQTGGAELVQRASPPSGPSSPKPARNMALGIVLGALLGFGLAALLERIDRRVRTVEELERLYGLPVLARIPLSSKLEGRVPEGIGPQTQEGEAFRLLRSNLRYFDIGQKSSHSVLMVSPEEGDGKSTVARGLATTMAEMGDDVVFVEADLRKGGEFRQVTGAPADGLSSVLAGAPLERVLLRVEVPGMNAHPRALAVLPSGPPPPNPSELLESERMGEVLAQLQDNFSYVILDSPALGAVSDALALVPEVSEVVVVGGLSRTTRDAARDLSKQFSLLDKKPIGVIVNFAEAERAKYSHYYRSEPADGEPPS